MGYIRLRFIIQEAWEAVPEEFFIKRLRSSYIICLKGFKLRSILRYIVANGKAHKIL